MYLEVIRDFINQSEVHNIKTHIERFYESHSIEDGSIKWGLANLVRKPRDEKDKNLVKELTRFFWQSPIPNFYRDKYKEEPLFLAEFCTFRRKLPVPDDKYLPWHLDANFYGFEIPMLTFWMPLVDVGVQAPGLEFCLPRHSVPAEQIMSKWSSLRSAKRPFTLTDAQIPWFMETEDIDRSTIQIGPGDVAVFDQYVLHRTERNEKASTVRIAIEFRIASASRLPKGVNLDALGNMIVSHHDPNSGSVSLTSHRKYFSY